jgi:L-asparaginase II
MNISKDMSSRPEVLVNVTRGSLIESRHYGHIAVVDSRGILVAAVGDPFYRTYLRSSAKPLQTLAVILSGAADRYGFTDCELSVMSASHYGEDFHRKAVLSILEKAGCTPAELLCGSVFSLNNDYALKMALQGHDENPLFSDCSGKHAGMLAVCKHKGWDTANYTDPNHELQKYVTEIIAEMSETPVSEIDMAIDGCGSPVHGMPLYNMANAFARFASPQSLSQNTAKACERVFAAMVNCPEMVSGTGGFCTELIKNTHGNLIGKIGAEAVYVVGIKKQQLGIAIKLEDGNLWRIAPAVVHTLKELKILDDSELDALRSFLVMENRNKHGQIVGEVFPGFGLW